MASSLPTRGPLRAWMPSKTALNPDDVKAIFGDSAPRCNDPNPRAIRVSCEIWSQHGSARDGGSVEAHIIGFGTPDKPAHRFTNLDMSKFEGFWTGGVYKTTLPGDNARDKPREVFVLILHQQGPRPFGPAYKKRKASDKDICRHDMFEIKRQGWTFPKSDVKITLEIDGKAAPGAEITVNLQETAKDCVRVPSLGKLYDSEKLKQMYCCGYRVAGPNHLVKLVSTTPPPPYPENAGSPEQTDSGTGLAVCTVNPQAQPTENKAGGTSKLPAPAPVSNGAAQPRTITLPAKKAQPAASKDNQPAQPAIKDTSAGPAAAPSKQATSNGATTAKPATANGGAPSAAAATPLKQEASGSPPKAPSGGAAGAPPARAPSPSSGGREQNSQGYLVPRVSIPGTEQSSDSKPKSPPVIVDGVPSLGEWNGPVPRKQSGGGSMGASSGRAVEMVRAANASSGAAGKAGSVGNPAGSGDKQLTSNGAVTGGRSAGGSRGKSGSVVVVEDGTEQETTGARGVGSEGNAGSAAAAAAGGAPFRAAMARDPLQPGYLECTQGARPGGSGKNTICCVCSRTQATHMNKMFLCTNNCGWGAHRKCLNWAAGTQRPQDWCCCEGCQKDLDAKRNGTAPQSKEKSASPKQPSASPMDAASANPSPPAAAAANAAAPAAAAPAAAAEPAAVVRQLRSSPRKPGGTQAPASSTAAPAPPAASKAPAAPAASKAAAPAAAAAAAADKPAAVAPAAAADKPAEQKPAVKRPHMEVYSQELAAEPAAPDSAGRPTRSRAAAAAAAAATTEAPPALSPAPAATPTATGTGGTVGAVDMKRIISTPDEDTGLAGYLDYTKKARPGGNCGDEPCFVCNGRFEFKKNALYLCDNDCGWSAHHKCLNLGKGVALPDPWFCCLGCKREYDKKKDKEEQAKAGKKGTKRSSTGAITGPTATNSDSKRILPFPPQEAKPAGNRPAVPAAAAASNSAKTAPSKRARGPDEHGTDKQEPAAKAASTPGKRSRGADSAGGQDGSVGGPTAEAAPPAKKTRTADAPAVSDPAARGRSRLATSTGATTGPAAALGLGVGGLSDGALAGKAQAMEGVQQGSPGATTRSRGQAAAPVGSDGARKAGSGGASQGQTASRKAPSKGTVPASSAGKSVAQSMPHASGQVQTRTPLPVPNNGNDMAVDSPSKTQESPGAAAAAPATAAAAMVGAAPAVEESKEQAVAASQAAAAPAAGNSAGGSGSAGRGGSAAHFHTPGPAAPDAPLSSEPVEPRRASTGGMPPSGAPLPPAAPAAAPAAGYSAAPAAAPAAAAPGQFNGGPASGAGYTQYGGPPASGAAYGGAPGQYGGPPSGPAYGAGAGAGPAAAPRYGGAPSGGAPSSGGGAPFAGPYGMPQMGPGSATNSPYPPPNYPGYGMPQGHAPMHTPPTAVPGGAAPGVAPPEPPPGCAAGVPIPSLPHPAYDATGQLHPTSRTTQMMALANVVRYLGRSDLVRPLMKACTTNALSPEVTLLMTVHYSSLMVFWEVGDVEGIMAVLKEDFNLPV